MGVVESPPLSLQFAAEPGDVLVHPEAFFTPLGDLHEGFSVRRFMDLCGAIEAVVLNERLIFVSTDAELETLAYNNAFAYELIRHDFVVPVGVGAPIEWVSEQLRQVDVRIDAVEQLLLSRDPVVSPEDPEEHHRVTASSQLLEAIFWEEALQVPLVPTIQQAPAFIEGHGLPYRLGLYLRYGEASERHQRVRATIDPVDYLRVPPIALAVLRKCEGVQDLPGATLAMRKDLAKLRAIRCQLDELTRNRHVSPEAKRRRRDDFQRRWSREVDSQLGSKSNETVLPVPSTTASWGELTKVAGAAVVGGPTSPSFWTGLANALVKLGPATIDWVRGAPFRPLGSALRSSLRTSAGEIDAIVERLFDYRLTDREMRRAAALADAAPQRFADPGLP